MSINESNARTCPQCGGTINRGKCSKCGYEGRTNIYFLAVVGALFAGFSFSAISRTIARWKCIGCGNKFEIAEDGRCPRCGSNQIQLD